MMKKIKLSAPAKINLSLDVIGLRSDGFHEVQMIMQSINLCDSVKIKKQTAGIALKIKGACLPQDEGNIAYRAAQLFLEKTGISSGVEIKIKKNIPVAAGLAGGSSDAAAVLWGLNKLFAVELSPEELHKMALALGCDVVFCLTGGTAFVYGIGEKIELLPDIKKQQILIVNPGFKVSTAEVYKEYDRLKPELEIPTTRLVEILRKKKKITWEEGWQNVLEVVTGELFSDIRRIKKELQKYRIDFCLMSGSGPTVYAVVPDAAAGKKIIASWPYKNDFLYLTSTMSARG